MEREALDICFEKLLVINSKNMFLKIFFSLLVTQNPCEVLRNADLSEFSGKFSVVKTGQFQGKLLLKTNKIDYVSCLLQCVYHLKCKSVNYNHSAKICELFETNLNGKTIRREEGWTVFGTKINSDQVRNLLC